MFFLSMSLTWSFTYFFNMSYIFIMLILIFYCTAIIYTNDWYNNSKTKLNSVITSNYDIFSIIIIPMLVVYALTNLWVSNSFSTWFGHLIISSFQLKFTYLVLIFFIITMFILLSHITFTSQESYDFIIININFLYWLILIFFSNSLFTAIFIVEVISSLIMLFLVASTFSTLYFYRNLTFNLANYIHLTMPHTQIQSLILFFWMSLIASLSLFIFLILVFQKLHTLDWYIIEYIFSYIILSLSTKDVIGFSIIWLIFIFSIFLKCGIAPFFIWKPKFFKGLSFYSLFFYISFFYFFIFIFFLIIISLYLDSIFYYFSVVTFLFLTIGLILLIIVICESFYVKSFIAMSSILNSILVLLSISSTHTSTLSLWV
jgi:hypothetical protein